MQTTRIAITIGLVTFASYATCVTGCREKLTNAECDALMNKLVDLRIDEDPRAKEMTAEQREATRANAKNALSADPDAKKIEADCRTEVSRKELACALDAKTSAAWNACIE